MTYRMEHKPLLPDGFQEIGIWQLDAIFLEPFGENEHRKKLINRLRVYLNEFMAIGIDAEVWIDGSFATEKPEPEDIDIALVLDEKAVENLDERRAAIFQELLMERDRVKARYSCDVYFIPKDDNDEKNKWIETYGRDSRKLNTKGIFKLSLTSHV